MYVLVYFFLVQRIVLGVWVRGGFERVFGGGWGHKSVYVRAIFFNNVLVIHAYAFGSLARCLMSGIFAFRVVCVVS